MLQARRLVPYLPYPTERHSLARISRKTYVGFVRHRDNWYKGEHEPLISEETYDSSIALLRKNKQAYERNSRTGKVTSYLGGLLVCARCGAKYTKITAYTKNKNGETTHKRYYYACKNRTGKSEKHAHCDNDYYRMEVLDELIFNELRKLALNPESIPENAQEADTSLIEKEIEEIDVRINRLLDLYESGNIQTATLQDRIIALQARKEALEEDLELEKTSVQRTKSDVTNVIQSVDDVLRLGSFNDVRAILTDLISKIVIDGQDQTIHWNF